MRLVILVAHCLLVVLLGALFGQTLMLAFVSGEVFVIAAIETIEGRGPFKWIWKR